MEPEQAEESKLLNQHSGLRESISALPEFVEWRGQLPTVVVDGITYYVRGGDMLKDHDQIIVEWVRRFSPHVLNDSGQER